MATDKNVIRTGDMVKICIDNAVGYGGTYPVWLTDGMKEFDGEEFKVSRIYGNAQKAYELHGVNNKHGMPYTWMREALVKLKQVSHENRND